MYVACAVTRGKMEKQGSNVFEYVFRRRTSKKMGNKDTGMAGAR
jgi:hypothetical protein